MNDFQTFSGFWCRVPGELPEYSLFRRKFRLNAPAELRLFVSADSRYNLYLDGRFLGRGPVRGDLEHYHYEKYELELNPGDHLLAAEVPLRHEHRPGRHGHHGEHAHPRLRRRGSALE